jgi:hypothetical protein
MNAGQDSSPSVPVALCGTIAGSANVQGRPIRRKSMDEAQCKLAMAARHVAEGRRIVARQRERVAGLKALGHCSKDHELTLAALVSTLAHLEDQAQALRKVAKKLERAHPLLS